MYSKLLLLAAAGALGTLARYGSGVFIQRIWPGSMALWPTVFVNMAGCLAFGFVFGLVVEKWGWDGNAKVILLTGFMGAFTTFSTFAFDTAALLRDSHYVLAMANVVGQNVAGVAFLFLGLVLGRLL